MSYWRVPLDIQDVKIPKGEISEAIHQSIRNQSDEYIPRLFIY